MGLDVYLYRYEDFDAAERIENEYEERSAAIWKEIEAGRDYDALADDEKEDARRRTDALKTEMGLGEYGEVPEPAKQRIRQKSSKHPEHLFEVGYLRSSYNEGGINLVVETALGKDALYWVFCHDREEASRFTPDWRASLERAKALLAEWTAHVAENTCRVSVIDHNCFTSLAAFGVTDERSALALYRQQRENNQDRAGDEHNWFSMRDGHFYLGKEPMRVRALLTGTRQSWRGAVEPVVYAVYEAGDDLGWYTKALEVTVEMCEYVLAQPDPEKYVLHWSG